MMIHCTNLRFIIYLLFIGKIRHDISCRSSHTAANSIYCQKVIADLINIVLSLNNISIFFSSAVVANNDYLLSHRIR